MRPDWVPGGVVGSGDWAGPATDGRTELSGAQAPVIAARGSRGHEGHLSGYANLTGTVMIGVLDGLSSVNTAVPFGSCVVRSSS